MKCEIGRANNMIRLLNTKGFVSIRLGLRNERLHFMYSLVNFKRVVNDFLYLNVAHCFRL